jgi:hypothetical protein
VEIFLEGVFTELCLFTMDACKELGGIPFAAFMDICWVLVVLVLVYYMVGFLVLLLF